MRIELDHLFVCANVGAPEAEELMQFGFAKAFPIDIPVKAHRIGVFPF